MTIAYTYEDLTVEKLLREAIIEQAKASLNMSVPHDKIWSVAIDWHPRGKYEASVVVFEDPKSLKCLRFWGTSGEEDTLKAALERLLATLRFDAFDRR